MHKRVRHVRGPPPQPTQSICLQLKSSSVHRQARSLSSPVTTPEVAAVESTWSEGKLILLRTSVLANDEGPAEARCKS